MKKKYCVFKKLTYMYGIYNKNNDRIGSIEYIIKQEKKQWVFHSPDNIIWSSIYLIEIVKFINKLNKNII